MIGFNKEVLYIHIVGWDVCMNQNIALLEAHSEQTDERLKQLEQRMGHLEELIDTYNSKWDQQWQKLMKRLSALEQAG
jgi:hypothetical protein